MNTIEFITKKYFDAFKNKNIESLDFLYSEDVTLSDPNGFWQGKENVINENKELFELDYELTVIRSEVTQYKSYNIIKIKFTDVEVEIMDVIEFDDYFKIKSVNAYKK